MTTRTPLLLSLVLALTTGCAAKQAHTPSHADPAPTAKQPLPDPRAPMPHRSADVHLELIDNFKRVHFPFDSAELQPEARAVLTRNAEILLENPDVTVVVAGHTDEFGDDEYNLALGQRRARVVRDYLVALGVDDEQLGVLSYGEYKPLIDADSPEEGLANRRAEFVVVTGEDEADGTRNNPLKVDVFLRTDS